MKVTKELMHPVCWDVVRGAAFLCLSTSYKNSSRKVETTFGKYFNNVTAEAGDVIMRKIRNCQPALARGND